MRLFIKKILLFTLLSVVLVILPGFLLYLKLPVNYETNGLASSIDKHKRLSGIKEPKIIIVGGSGCGMGINSEMIDTSLANFDVVNMGIFGQFGLYYMINEIKNDIKKGDIVLIIPEYQHFFYQFYGDLGLLREIRIYPEGIRYLNSPKQWQVILKNLGPYYVKQFEKNEDNQKDIPDMWNRKNVNKYGDFCGHLDLEDTVDVKTLPLFASAKNPVMDLSTIDELNEFAEYTKSQEADILFVYPAIPKEIYYKYHAQIENLHNALTNGLEFPILNTTTSHNLDDIYFYDTVYHLNKKGRNMRTSKLIEDLKRWIKQNPITAEIN